MDEEIPQNNCCGVIFKEILPYLLFGILWNPRIRHKFLSLYYCTKVMNYNVTIHKRMVSEKEYRAYLLRGWIRINIVPKGLYTYNNHGNRHYLTNMNYLNYIDRKTYKLISKYFQGDNDIVDRRRSRVGQTKKSISFKPFNAVRRSSLVQPEPKIDNWDNIQTRKTGNSIVKYFITDKNDDNNNTNNDTNMLLNNDNNEFNHDVVTEHIGSSEMNIKQTQLTTITVKNPDDITYQ